MTGLGLEGQLLIFIGSSHSPRCVLILQSAIYEVPQYNSNCLFQHNRYLVHLPTSLLLLLLGHYHLLNQPQNRSLHQATSPCWILPVIGKRMRPQPFDYHYLQGEDIAETLIEKSEVKGMIVVPNEIMQVDEVEFYIAVVVVDDLFNRNVHFLEIAFLLQPAMDDELQQEMLHLLLNPFLAFPFARLQVFFCGNPQQNILDQFIIRREVVLVTYNLCDIDELINDNLVIKYKQFLIIQCEEVAEIAPFPSGPSQTVTAISLEQIVGMHQDHIDQICLGFCLKVIVMLGWVEKLSDELGEEVDGGLEASKSCLFKNDVQIVLSVLYGPQYHLKLHLSVVLSHALLPSLFLHALLSLQCYTSPTISVE